jgi:hypothetical protein
MITRNDIIPVDVYSEQRATYRASTQSIKNQRRLQVGPDIMVLFENKQTLLYQIQEMLWIERGGDAQLDDEIAAYSPLVPTGTNLCCTVMIGIPDPAERRLALKQLGHIEKHIFLHVGRSVIPATPLDDLERTDQDGKTSSVHFLQFQLTADMIQSFKDPNTSVSLQITHPRYTYHANLDLPLRETLTQDFHTTP